MKIDGDYLWDKTGEPDPDIQQLEEILGTLRYQPRPLEIPAGLTIGRQRMFFRGFAPPLAIAATIAMLLLGLGVWRALQRSQRTQPPESAKSLGTPAVKPMPAEQPPPDRENQSIATIPGQNYIPATPRRHRVNHSLTATNTNRVRNEARNIAELKEAEAAKDQLMLALRLTSAKLNFAQKRMQGTSPRDSVHNQHKIG